MYQYQKRVTYSDIDGNKKVPMDQLLNFFQDCSTFHSEELKIGMDYLQQRKRVWIMTAWQVELTRYPEFGETLIIGTWPYDFKGMYGYRNFDIVDQYGQRIAKVNSLWVNYDLAQHCPTKIEECDRASYVTEPKLEMDYAPRKIKVSGEYQEGTPILIQYHHLDSNGHVNNAKYPQIALDAVQAIQGYCYPLQMRVDYRKETKLGETVIPRIYLNDECVQVEIVDSEGTTHVIVEFSCFS